MSEKIMKTTWFTRTLTVLIVLVICAAFLYMPNGNVVRADSRFVTVSVPGDGSSTRAVVTMEIFISEETQYNYFTAYITSLSDWSFSAASNSGTPGRFIVTIDAPAGQIINNFSMDIGYDTDAPSYIFQVLSITYSSPNQPTPTPVSTPIPTATPRPSATPRSTATPRPTTAPVATSTPAPTAAATDVPVAPVIVDTTEAPTATPVPSATATPEATATATAEATETADTLPEVTEAVIVDETTDPAVTDEETTQTSEETQAETTVRAAGYIKTKPQEDEKKSSFPWWILLLLLGVVGGRYFFLRKQGYNNSEAIEGFIPGIGHKTSAGRPSTGTSVPQTATARDDAPVVVNGYLKKSNTASIRPMYSNTPEARAADAKAMAESDRSASAAPSAFKPVASASGTAAAKSSAAPSAAPGLKAPIKRPKELSSGRALEAAKERQAGKEASAPAGRTTTASAKSLFSADKKEPVKTQTEAPEKTAARSKSPFAAKQEAAQAQSQAPSAVKKDRPATKPGVYKVKASDSKRQAPAYDRSTSTMNRPNSSALNENATPTAAASAYSKVLNEQKYAPAIATQFVPPVIEEKKEEKKASPFKPGPKAPIRRPNSADVSEIKEKPKAPESLKKYVPPVAQFTSLAPIVQKPASPFKQISQEEVEKIGEEQNDHTLPGTKAPIKRPKSASVNRAAAMKEERTQKRSTVTSMPSSGNRPFNAAAAMKELREMKESEPEDNNDDSHDSGRAAGGGGRGRLGRFHRKN